MAEEKTNNMQNALFELGSKTKEMKARDRLADYNLRSNEKKTKEQEYLEIFDNVQRYIVETKMSELNDALANINQDEKDDTLKRIILSYLRKTYPNILNQQYLNEIATKCEEDMTGYGVLNKYFAQKEDIEEININSWETIVVKWRNREKEIVSDKFHSPQQAKDVFNRIVQSTGNYLDDNKVTNVTNLGKSIRVATAISPIVDSDVGICASIRFIHSAVYTEEALIENGFMTEKMANLLNVCLNHGVSICVCGATGSGKTTVCNAILESVAPETRLITLEAGTREFDLVRKDENNMVYNDRIHWQTRPHKDDKLNIDLQELLDLVLRFDPEIVVVGEMVSEEAFIASETARTGHTVMTTIHTKNAYDAYYRMYSLGIRKYPIDEKTMLKFMVDAFPIIVYAKKYADGKRRIQSILEGQFEDGQIKYNELYHFNVRDTIETNGKTEVLGEFEEMNKCTDKLKVQMMDNGASRQTIKDL